MMELFSLVLKGAVTEGEAAHVGIETLSRQIRNPSADIVEGEAAHVTGMETILRRQKRNPSPSAGEAQVGETSKQSRKPSESRDSSMYRGLKDDVVIVAGEAQVGETSKQNRNPSGRNVQSMVQFYERCTSGSKTTKEDQWEQAFDSKMELARRSPRQKPSVPGVQQHPDLTPPTSSIPVDVAANDAAPPPEEATSKSTKGESEQEFDSTREVVKWYVSPRKNPSVRGVQQHPDFMTPPTSGVIVAVAAKSAAPPPDAEAASKTVKEDQGEQAFDSTVELVRRSPRQQHPDLTPDPMRGILVDVAGKSTAAPPPEVATSDASTRGIQRGSRRVRRKISSSVHKEIIHAADVRKEMIQAADVHRETTQAVENATKILAQSIDRIHSTKLQIAENKVKSQERLFNTELVYMKKRDRQLNRNQKNLISAINGLTKIITTGLKNTSAGDAVQPENAHRDVNNEATRQDTLQTVYRTTQQAAEAQE